MDEKIPNQEEVWNSISRSWKSFRTKPVGEVVNFIENKKGTILDLGCGSGRNFLSGFNDLKWYGVDFSENMLKHAKKYSDEIGLDIDLRKADLFDLPFEDCFFDSVICIAVLHCIPSADDRKKSLQAVHRVLKDKGKMLISVWDKGQDKFNDTGKENLFEWNVGDKKFDRYYYLYDRKEFVELLEEVGFRVLDVYDNDNPKGIYSNKNIIAVVEKLVN